MPMEFEQQRAKLISRLSDPNDEKGYFDAASKWALNIAGRKGSVLGAMKHNEKRHPEQKLTVSKLEAKDPFGLVPDNLYYRGIDLILSGMIGKEDYQLLTEQFQAQTVSPDSSELLIDRLAENQRQGLNTMIALGHYALFDMGIVRGLVLRANEDRANIGSTGVLLNNLMTMQSYHGVGLVNYFRPTANIYFCSPKSESAKIFGVPKGAEALANSLFMLDLRHDLGRGGLELYAAMTGKQIMPIEKDGRLLKYQMPEIPSANYIRGFDQMVGVTIAKSQSNGHWGMEVSGVVDVRASLAQSKPEEVVEALYDGIALSVGNITDVETISPRQTRLDREAKEATQNATVNV